MAQVTTVRSRLRSERGAELIEFALIFPLLLLVVLGIVDFGFLFQRYEVLTNATREGARLASLPGYTADDVKSRVCAFLMTGGVPTTGCVAPPAVSNPTNPVVNVTTGTVAVPSGLPNVSVSTVTLTYTHNFMFVGPIIGLMGGTWTNAKTITLTAVMRNEL